MWLSSGQLVSSLTQAPVVKWWPILFPNKVVRCPEFTVWTSRGMVLVTMFWVYSPAGKACSDLQASAQTQVENLAKSESLGSGSHTFSKALAAHITHHDLLWYYNHNNPERDTTVMSIYE